ncbi:15270_t:CDS:10 [Cetraspora pellucida]|uniref:Transcription initiation factor TFIID subunit 2 n=1 Tax=Cetraspora pellucida TaxID=1433469 RepID=A0A9N9DM58_9GLOM|nr:15270_t:CDS:10 [Cetraspora pellucida]
MVEAKKTDLFTRLKVYVDDETAERGYVYSVSTIALEGLNSAVYKVLNISSTETNVKFFSPTYCGYFNTPEHQKVDIQIDMLNQIVKGYTEISLKPLRFDIDIIRLHCRQCRISTIKVNDLLADFEINESEDAGIVGEITIYLPDEITDIPIINGVSRFCLISIGFLLSYVAFQAEEWVPLIVRVDFILEKPKAGVHFKLPDDDKQKYKSQCDPYMFTINSPLPGATRCWLPCLDRIRDRCSWDFFITVTDIEGFNSIMVVCSGNLVKMTNSPISPNQRTFHYNQPVAIPAQYIGVVCGPFVDPFVLDYPLEALPPNRPKIIAYISEEWQHWLLPTLYPDGDDEPTEDTYWLHRAMDYFIEEYSHFNLHPEFDKNNPIVKPGSFPFKRFQIVFVDHSYTEVNVCAGLLICRLNILYNQCIIDQREKTRRALIAALAQQWRDYWLAGGLSNFWASMYFQNIYGILDSRYRRKKDIELVCELDVNRYPLCTLDIPLPFQSKDIEFINLKASLVLWMFNKRLTFYDYRRGIPGIIYLILNGAKEDVEQGKRPGFLHTEEFLEMCKSVIRQELRNEVKKFEKQWIYGSGCPKFKIRASFNRKKLAVEFKFEQENTNTSSSDSTAGSKSTYTPRFTGHMDISIKEPDGLEYIHTIYVQEKRESHSLFYHTKYKRSKLNIRPHMRREKGTLEAHPPSSVFDEDQRDLPQQWGMDPESDSEDLPDWKIQEWIQEYHATSDQWEWIRVDDAFSWIAIIDFEQDDYMWAALLESSRDVIAQYEAIKALSKKPSRACSTTLMRTIRDWRYYYRIRMDAAFAMAKCATSDLDFIGISQLMKLYETDYCEHRIEGGFFPKINDFSDWEEYYVQRAIPYALSCARDSGNTPSHVKEFLLYLLSWNDNQTNLYSDDYFIANLIESLGNTFIPDDDQVQEGSADVEVFDFASQSRDYLEETLETLERYFSRHELFGSYQALIVVAIIKVRMHLMLNQLIAVDGREFIIHARYGNYVGVRIAALEALIVLDLHQKPEVAKFFDFLAEKDSDLAVRRFLNAKFKEDRGPWCWNFPRKIRSEPTLIIRYNRNTHIGDSHKLSGPIYQTAPSNSIIASAINQKDSAKQQGKKGSSISEINSSQYLGMHEQNLKTLRLKKSRESSQKSSDTIQKFYSHINNDPTSIGIAGVKNVESELESVTPPNKVILNVQSRMKSNESHEFNSLASENGQFTQTDPQKISSPFQDHVKDESSNRVQFDENSISRSVVQNLSQKKLLNKASHLPLSESEDLSLSEEDMLIKSKKREGSEYVVESRSKKQKKKKYK